MADEVTELRSQLAATQARLAAMEATATDTAATAALTQAITSSGVTDWNPGAVEQVAQLLKNDVRTHRDGSQLVVTGPGFTSLTDHVKGKLADPSFAHFRRSGGGASPAAASTSSAAPTSFGPISVQPDENLGTAIVRHAAQYRATAGDAARDISRPFGLTRRGA